MEEPLSTVNMDGTPIPIICRPANHFLEILWGYKDRSIISIKENHERETYEQLKGLPKDVYCHLEGPDDKGLVVVWRMKDWNSHYKALLLKKEESEIRVTQWNNGKETKAYLMKLIVAKMGPIMDGPMGENFANEILKTKNSAAVTMLGGDMSLIKW